MIWDYREQQLSLAGPAHLAAGALALATAQGPSSGAGAWVWGSGKPPVTGPIIEASSHRKAICSCSGGNVLWQRGDFVPDAFMLHQVVSCP